MACYYCIRYTLFSYNRSLTKIIRRSSEEEKVLVICRKRPGHTCQYAVTVIIIMLWEGVARPLADFAYANYSDIIPKNGEPTERRCGTNEEYVIYYHIAD